MRVLRPTWLLLLFAGAAGCGESGFPVGTPKLELRIPAGEAASTGSYTVVVRWPEQPADRIEGEREGRVTHVWFHDLDADGRGEVLVVLQSVGSGSYGGLHVFRRDDGGNWRRRELPEFTEQQSVGYQGHDRFEIVDGQLQRVFPIYLAGDDNSAPSGGASRWRLAPFLRAWEPVD